MYDNQFASRFESELAYHQVRTGRQGEIVVYGPDSNGVYTFYTAVVMREAPQLAIEFHDESLSVEPEPNQDRPHRVRFRICGPSGYVTDRDLRHLIKALELNAQL